MLVLLAVIACSVTVVSMILDVATTVKYPVKCYRCKYSVRSKNHPFKYVCNKYVYFMDPFDYCSKGKENE